MPTSARADRTDFSEICGEFAAFQWADVGIGPYNEIDGAYGFASDLCFLPLPAATSQALRASSP